MDLASLAAVIGPPPDDSFPVDWPAVEELLGMSLPEDFKAFGHAYGPVDVGEWLRVTVPSVVKFPGDYQQQLDYHHKVHRGMRDEDPISHPFAFHPEPGGLLVWGASRDSKVFFWDTSASTDPNDWPTLLYERPNLSNKKTDAESWRTIAAPMTDIAAAVVQQLRQAGRAPNPAVRRLPAQPFTPPRPQPPMATSAQGVHLAQSLLYPPAPDRFQPPPGSFPSDYAALLARTGPGALAGVLKLLAPDGPAGFDQATEHRHHAERLATRRAAKQRVVPAPIAPQPGGLHLWGVFGTGETAWWLPDTPNPDTWPTILVDTDGVGWQRFNTPTTDFLGQWLNGTIDPPVLSVPPQQRPRTLHLDQPVPPAPTSLQRDPLAQLQTIYRRQPSPHTYDWAAICADLGITALPRDYRRLLEAHGPVNINGIFVNDPNELLETHDAMAAGAEDCHDGPFHPEPGGLLACGSTESRSSIYWDTTNPDPDHWTIFLSPEMCPEAFNGTLTELIIADLTGNLDGGLTALTPSDPDLWPPHDWD